ncbi:hypothetical protein ACH5RR_001608 [Cinchona calisaya]|uniref:Hexosyltransferase n=1 Tax=Cinchona calisaya TaxID=153742 RepID=A0ABD3B543_9GENT
MLAIIKMIANSITISMVLIILFFPSFQSSPPPPAIAIRSSSFSIITQRTRTTTSSLHHQQFIHFRRSLQQLKNGENSNCSSRKSAPNNPSFVHVAMTLDVQFLRGTIAALHSILQNSLCPENIFFHFIYSDSDSDSAILLQSLIRDIFPFLKFKAYYFNPEIVQNKISSTVRETLEQPLNYARNYLAFLLGPCVERVIYLDSDVILVDDILKLWRTNLDIATVGSPEYCHANFTKYFTPKFWSQKEFFSVFSGRKPCYFNTGVMVIDLVKWRKFGYTQKIERWMEIQRKHRVYDLGSLPPFLLVFAGEIAPINHRWNQHGLGGDNLSGYCRQLHPGPVSLLHWSGKGKPWLRLDSGKPCPLDIIWSQYDLRGPSL